MLADRNILIGVTGGIAAYKSALLVRELVKQSAQVRVMMTRAAEHFVSRLTFSTLCGYPVRTDVFSNDDALLTPHIDWARWADIICIAPATAQTLARIAHGMADDMISATVLAAKGPVLLCPSMNTAMYQNSAVVENEKKCISHGCKIVAPDQGMLACGEYGTGRFPDTQLIIQTIENELGRNQDLKDRRLLVTAGPTREAVDAVRFISNRSSGKMGYALARAAVERGADVTLISGPVNLEPVPGARMISVETAEQMADAVQTILPDSDVFIMAAAVADYRPSDPVKTKMKKGSDSQKLNLIPTTDILSLAGQKKKQRIHVGFALETENASEHAREKLTRKNCDFVVLNRLGDPGAAFDVETNKVTLYYRDGREEKLPLMSKKMVAEEIINRILKL